MAFYYSPVLTSRAVADDADTTQGPLGRAVRISAGSLGSLPPSCRGATGDSATCPPPFTLPSGEEWESKLCELSSGKYNLDTSGWMCSLFKYITQRDFWWPQPEQHRWGEEPPSHCGSAGMTLLFDFHPLVLKLCDQAAKLSFGYSSSVFSVQCLLIEPTHNQQSWDNLLPLRVLAPWSL